MKKCSTCKEEKDEKEFGKDKRVRDGLRSQCKVCRYKATAAWRERNKERVKENWHNYYLANRDDLIERSKEQWVNTSPEEKKRRAEYYREYYRKNSDKLLEDRKTKRLLRTEEQVAEDYLRQHEYYEKNKEVIKARARDQYKNLSEQQKKRRTESIKDYRRRNSEKAKAWSAVGNAIMRGEIEKPIYCELCGVFHVKIHAHHEDYSKPLDVLWLCQDCHQTLHVEKRIAINASNKENL